MDASPIEGLSLLRAWMTESKTIWVSHATPFSALRVLARLREVDEDGAILDIGSGEFTIGRLSTAVFSYAEPREAIDPEVRTHVAGVWDACLQADWDGGVRCIFCARRAREHCWSWLTGPVRAWNIL